MAHNSIYELELPAAVLSLMMNRQHPLHYVWIDPAGAIVNASKSFYYATGYEQSELAELSLSALVDFNERVEVIYERFLKSCDQDEQPGLPVIVHTKDGTGLRGRYAISRNRTGHPFAFLLTLELHDTVRTESGLLQRFSGMFLKDVNLGVLLINIDFQLIDISDMACKVLGVDKGKVLNRPMEDIFKSVPLEHRLVQRTILDGVVVRNHAVSWTNNEDRYELLMDSSLLRDENGSTVGAYIIFKDVTNLRSLEEQVQRSDRLAMIGQIAAGTAHEIRNPLTSIKGFLQVFKNTLLEKGLTKEHNYTEIMLSEINRINNLVSEFLLLSKPKNVVYQQVDVTSVFREILPIINNEAILHGVSIQYEAAFDMPMVIADNEMLKQVFLNICKNGIEAMSDGGELIIAEKIDESERRVCIDIRDNGPGIPSFLIDKIFDPFFTTKTSGTGLGLSVCQRIIHDIGGAIRVSSKGFGTTFTVTIPYK